MGSPEHIAVMRTGSAWRSKVNLPVVGVPAFVADRLGAHPMIDADSEHDAGEGWWIIRTGWLLRLDEAWMRRVFESTSAPVLVGTVYSEDSLFIRGLSASGYWETWALTGDVFDWAVPGRNGDQHVARIPPSPPAPPAPAVAPDPADSAEPTADPDTVAALADSADPEALPPVGEREPIDQTYARVVAEVDRKITAKMPEVVAAAIRWGADAGRPVDARSIAITLTGHLATGVVLMGHLLKAYGFVVPL